MTPQLSRSVHDLSTRFLNMKANEINTLEQGLQIREDRFDSDTRLQYFQGLARNSRRALKISQHFSQHSRCVLGLFRGGIAPVEVQP